MSILINQQEKSGPRFSIQSLLNGFAEPTWLCDHKGHIVNLNNAAKTLLKTYGQQEPASLQLPKVLGIDQLKFSRVAKGTLRTTANIPSRFETVNPINDERSVVAMTLSSVRTEGNSQPTHLLVKLTDNNSLLERKFRRLKDQVEQVQEELKKQVKQSITDPLTGLLNRRAISNEFSDVHSPFHNDQQTHSIAIIDIDDFKAINDSFGHRVGDEVLRGLAALMREQCREEDICCRWGGEEFVIALLDTDQVQALEAMQRLRIAVEKNNFGNDNRIIKITVTIGISEFTCEDNIIEVIESADAAMYKAKKSGKNSVLLSSHKHLVLDQL